MKRMTKRIISFVLVCIVCLSLSIPAFAATVSKVTYSTTNAGGNKATVFYVNANNKNTTKIKYTCTTGHLIDNKGFIQEHEGYFEIKIWGRNSTSESWTYISKTNVKDVTSKTISMKGYTQYKVQVYAWKATTICNYLGGRFQNATGGWCDWAGKTLPTCTFTAYSNVKSLAK